MSNLPNYNVVRYELSNYSGSPFEYLKRLHCRYIDNIDHRKAEIFDWYNVLTPQQLKNINISKEECLVVRRSNEKLYDTVFKLSYINIYNIKTKSNILSKFHIYFDGVWKYGYSIIQE